MMVMQLCPAGLAALSEEWIPMGVSPCYGSGYCGADNGLIARTPTTLELRFDHPLSPSIAAQDLGDGRLQVGVRLGPNSGFQMHGTLQTQGDCLVLVNADGERAADMRRLQDGRILLQLNGPGQAFRQLFLAL